ncbi:non-hydrolyzing UDP-N-acetylglucosamine 2-epimerase [Candidatus Cyanaurora vandensis]|uniref:non-hydrolyzing UDP-N-acetylglucosamine 2-epimerase n=1 Tax=Candidatus Cyanaurora vandensis TaxID=2714958 RepID=UPI00257F8ABA|nr:UDP-N-acetylglucosamine 2-epimerase (non-hydrolyzing) [Candidatus Cyanaurora vandensis]
MRPKILVILGTRPEAVKLAPLILGLQETNWETIVIATGQHQAILHQTLGWFGITPAEDLQIMTPKQTLAEITCRCLTRLEERLAYHRPDLVIVQGDTTTTFAAGLAAFYARIPVGHVEAGLRTALADNPFPEEMNRRLTSQLARLHFAPTALAVQNLAEDGITEGVYLTGNTVIDALQAIAGQCAPPELPGVDWQQRVLLATVHRRENWGEPLVQIAQAFHELLDRFPDTCLVLPLHPNPTVREPLREILGRHPRAFLVEPLDYPQLVGVLKQCTLVLSDSGGIQEEAPALGKPVLVLRETTERPEAITGGVAQLVGTNTEQIVETASTLLTDPAAYTAMAQAINPFGDGQATGRIIQAVAGFFKS